MLRKILVTAVLASVLAIPAAALAGDGDSAMASFRKSHDDVIQLVDKHAPPTEVQAMVDGLLDYDWLAKAALGGPGRYDKRCADRCDQFKELLSNLIRKNYLKRIHAKDRGTVIYVDENVKKKATKVNTMVTFTDKDGITHTVEVAYVMHQVDGKWQVRDIITDGVSLAKNYKYEFNKLYREGGMDLVISRLQSKLSELAQAETP